MHSSKSYRECPRCRTKLDPNSKGYCAECKRAYAREYYRKSPPKRERCSRCKAPVRGKQTYCPNCRRAYQQARYGASRDPMACIKCGAVFERESANRRVCDECRGPAKPKPCADCGELAPVGRKYCAECGKITPQQRQALKKKAERALLPPKPRACRVRESKPRPPKPPRLCSCGKSELGRGCRVCAACSLENKRACWKRKNELKAAARRFAGCHDCGGPVEPQRRLCLLCRYDRARGRERIHEVRRRDRIAATCDGSVVTEEIWSRDKGRCRLCKAVIPPGNGHLDHIVPLSKGGPHWRENVQLLCAACNIWKGDALLFGRFYELARRSAPQAWAPKAR